MDGVGCGNHWHVWNFCCICMYIIYSRATSYCHEFTRLNSMKYFTPNNASWITVAEPSIHWTPSRADSWPSLKAVRWARRRGCNQTAATPQEPWATPGNRGRRPEWKGTLLSSQAQGTHLLLGKLSVTQVTLPLGRTKPKPTWLFTPNDKGCRRI